MTHIASIQKLSQNIKQSKLYFRINMDKSKQSKKRKRIQYSNDEQELRKIKILSTLKLQMMWRLNLLVVHFRRKREKLIKMSISEREQPVKDSQNIESRKRKKKHKRDKEIDQQNQSQTKQKEQLEGDNQIPIQIKKKKKKSKSHKKQEIQEFNQEKAADQQTIQENNERKKSKKKSKKSKKQQKQGEEGIKKEDRNLPEVSQEFDQPFQKGETLSKSLSKKKKTEKVQSLNILNRQLAKQCVAKRSNFYLQKIENMKKGLPVGRGSKKALEKIEQQRRKKLSQKNKINKNKKKTQEIQKNIIKKQEDESVESKQSPIKKKESIVSKKKKDQCTRQESIRIIKAFSVDAGDYKGMMKQMPDIPLAKIRGHLRMLFERNLQIITKSVQQSGRKINDWQLNQKRQIVRQLHRIRCTNRLLSEQNVEIREKFMKLMMSYNDPSIKLTDNDCNFLYRKIEAFVRGFCSIGTSRKKNQFKFQEPIEQHRSALLQGGRILNKTGVKRQVKIEAKVQQIQQKMIDPEKIIFQWSEQEQRQLASLYVIHQANSEAIHQQLKIKFGLNNRWKDFQILDRKIVQLIKMGLSKLKQLTSKPYNREQKIKQEQQKQKIPLKQTDPTTISQINSLDLMTKFIYNNKKVVVSKPDEPSEGGLLKNLSLLERQIFGHVQSIQARCALVKLLKQKFPPEEDVNQTVMVIKKFVNYADQLQSKNRIFRLNHEPILQEETDMNRNQSRYDEIAKELGFDENCQNSYPVSDQNKTCDQTEHQQMECQFFGEDEDIDELMNEALKQ